MWNKIIEVMRFGEDAGEIDIITDKEFEKRIRALGCNIYSDRYQYIIKNISNEDIALISKTIKLHIGTRTNEFADLDDGKKAELMNVILDYSCTRGIGNVQ